MHSARFTSITSSFSLIRTSFRRSSSRSSSTSSVSRGDNRYSYASTASSPVSEINAILSKQTAVIDIEEEKRSFGRGLDVLEPRPIMYWGGMEERMGSL